MEEAAGWFHGMDEEGGGTIVVEDEHEPGQEGGGAWVSGWGDAVEWGSMRPDSLPSIGATQQEPLPEGWRAVKDLEGCKIYKRADGHV